MVGKRLLNKLIRKAKNIELSVQQRQEKVSKRSPGMLKTRHTGI